MSVFQSLKSSFRSFRHFSKVALVGVLFQGLVWATPATAQQRQLEDSLSYSQLLTDIESNKVRRIEYDPVNSIASVYYKNANEGDVQRILLFSENTELVELAREKSVEFAVRPTADSEAVLNWLANLLVIGILLAALIIVVRRSSGAANQALNFGKSRARVLS